MELSSYGQLLLSAFHTLIIHVCALYPRDVKATSRDPFMLLLSSGFHCSSNAALVRQRKASQIQDDVWKQFEKKARPVGHNEMFDPQPRPAHATRPGYGIVKLPREPGLIGKRRGANKLVHMRARLS